LLGAALGILAAVVLFNSHIFHATPNAQADLFYTLRLSPQLALLGVIWALMIGFLGGLFPAIRAARLSIIDALRIA
jgi:putative ABC transport system permease protein